MGNGCPSRADRRRLLQHDRTMASRLEGCTANMGRRDAQRRDASDAQAQSDSRTHYESLIELLSDAVVLLEHDGRQIVAANTAAEQLLGHSRVALASLRLHDLCDPQEVPRLDGAVAALVGIGAARGVWRI